LCGQLQAFQACFGVTNSLVRALLRTSAPNGATWQPFNYNFGQLA